MSFIARRLLAAPAPFSRFSASSSLFARSLTSSRPALADQADIAAADPTQQSSDAGSRSGGEVGTVKWFDSSKGFGFITRDSGEDLFVHFTAIQGSGYRTLEEGQKVEFNVGAGQKGPVAQEVKVKKN